MGGDVHRHDLIPVLRLNVVERGTLPHHSGIADHHIKPLITFVERRSQPIDTGIVAHVERDQGGRTAGRTRCVVDFLERANGARNRDDVSAVARPTPRDAPVTSAMLPARGCVIDQLASASRES
jgi:hypothetical protein